MNGCRGLRSEMDGVRCAEHGDDDAGPTGRVLAGGGFVSNGVRNNPISGGQYVVVGDDGVFGIEAYALRPRKEYPE